MRNRTRLTLGVTAAAALAGSLIAPALASASSSSTAPGLRAVALAGSGSRLVSFAVDTPGTSRGIGMVMGLSGDTKLVGIDYRVQDGKLYGLGNKGGLYTIDDKTAVATRTSTPALPLDASTYFDIDFNPAADALRVISEQGQNLRVPMAVAGTAATVDTALTRPVTPTTNPPTSEPALGLTAAAYTNNDLDTSTGTTLFDLDTARDQVTIQAPANSGTTAATGNTGVDLASNSGLDIYSTLSNGKAVKVTAYAVSGSTFYSVDLLSGVATSKGAFADKTITDLALPLAQS